MSVRYAWPIGRACGKNNWPTCLALCNSQIRLGLQWGKHTHGLFCTPDHPPRTLTQGNFGELPPTAVSQLHVVHACGHHLLNMINMVRDMLRALHGGSLDLNLSKVQAATPIDEVRASVWVCLHVCGCGCGCVGVWV